MGPVVLSEWSVTNSSDSPYAPPELAGKALVGVVIGHPRKIDGSRIKTSTIRTVEGRLVTTWSGTVYLLQDPCPEYREWLREHKPNWNPDRPIVLK